MPAGGALVTATALGGAAVFIARRWLDSARLPVVHHADTDEARALVAACAEHLLRAHSPHVLFELAGELASGAMLLRPPPLKHGSRESHDVRLADGGTARLDWEHPAGGAARARGAILILPGLNNSSRSAYVQHTMAHLRRSGLSAACLDYRGVGGQALTSSRVGCADSWRDLPAAIDAMRALLSRASNGEVPLGAIGFSMGGTLLTKFLSVCGARSPFCAAVTVSSPFALTAAMRTLEGSAVARAMNFGLTQLAKLTFAAHGASRAHLHGIDWPAFVRSVTLRALEESVICKLHGYEDAEHYYAANRPDFARLATPLLCLHAEDDPIVAIGDAPLREMLANPQVAVAVTRRGGHLGWTGGTFSAPCSPTWSDLVAARHLLHHIDSAAAGARAAVTAARLPVGAGPQSRL
ncbi:hypothetical protein KFE25_007666 [Diacronema lutheri]|uniref:Serine aminopeptidase S33 domain-containing protein n=2 Tax=Diacronema lutheri TaxID=2081491 RepID=A0A8J6CIS0_DIALT|nr:hypothetical protein KFE25_007666 [Diacronema lutheri]